MTWREWWRRVAGSLGRGPSEADLQEELEFHRDMLAAQQRSADALSGDATRQARLLLGGPSQIAEQWRDQRGLPAADMLRQDLTYGLRTLRRSPGFTAAAIVTLAVGIGANTSIFSVVHAVILRPLPYVDPDRLVTIGDREADGMSSNVDFTTASDLRSRSHTLQSLALMRTWQPTLVAGGEAERIPAVKVSWNYFEMMGVRPALGRDFTPEDDRPDHWRVVILSDSLWRRRFDADPAAVGRLITMNDREYRIVGVLPPSFEPLDAARYYVRAQMWAPIGYDLSMAEACRGCRHLRAFARLAPGVTLAQATADLNAIREQLRSEYPAKYDRGSIAVVPLRDAITEPIRAALVILLGAVAFVLLIACANVASLLIARALARRRELAVRAVLGAGPARIARQLLTETALLSVAGGLAGLALSFAAVRILAPLAPVAVPRLDRVQLDGQVLAFTAVITLLTGLVFGLLPAWRVADAGLQQALATDSRTSIGGTSRARRALVVADLVLALVLLAGAGVMIRSVLALTHANAGFDPDDILTMQFSLVGKAYAEDPAVVAFQDRVLEQVRALPGVRAAALAGQVPFGGNFDCWGFHARGKIKPTPADDPCIQRYGTTPDYLRVMGIPLRAGRFFTDADTGASQPVIVVSESTAHLIWGSEDPIGAEVRIGDADRGAWRKVIGIVGDVHHADVASAPTAAMYTPQTQITDSFLVAVIEATTSDATSLVAPVRAILHGLDPAVPVYDVAPLEGLVAKASAQHVFVARLLSGFAVVAVLLAAVGLYGVISYNVAQRTREVGIRMALGARPVHIAAMIAAQAAWPIALGVAGGVAVAAATTRYLGALIFGVSPMDPPTLAAASALLLAASICAHWAPVRRALRIDSAGALRDE